MRKFLSLTGILCTLAAPAFAGNTSKSNGFLLHSPSFSQHARMPTLHTCDGKDISPSLTWTGTPTNTETFALILADPDAPGGTFYHWVLYNIPKTLTQLPEGITALPKETVVGITSLGKMQYNGPCPPKGTTHRYIFTLYALDTALTLSGKKDAASVLTAMQNHILAKATLQAVYSH